jgi:uncharacterized protein YdbL (DUF1318 family)
MKIKLILQWLITLFTILCATTAFALDLQTAREKGVVGEKLDGYITVVNPASGGDSLVTEVNARRKQEYQRISKENGKPVEIVAKLAAETIIQKLPVGSLYQSPSGNWEQK